MTQVDRYVCGCVIRIVAIGKSRAEGIGIEPCPDHRGEADTVDPREFKRWLDGRTTHKVETLINDDMEEWGDR